MSIGREALAQHVTAEMAERGWSYGEIVRRSGEYIKSASTLVNIVNANVKDVSESTLRGIARAFGVEPAKIFEIYYGTSAAPDRAGAADSVRAHVDIEEEVDGGVLIRIAPFGKTPDDEASEAIATRPATGDSPDVLRERRRRLELMSLLFEDIPDDCQLDTLASMIGLHQRRGRGHKIHERNSARALTGAHIDSLLRALRPEAGEAAAGRADEGRQNKVAGPTRLATPLHEYAQRQGQEQREDEDSRQPDAHQTGRNKKSRNGG